MPRENRALTRAARSRAREQGLTYQQARDDVRQIRELADDRELTFVEAEAFFDDPGNRLLCRTCGWTVGMICPECTEGCGCANSYCSGWRHDEYMDAEERAELDACSECGGDSTSDYGCECGE
ncbi:hypothetical protein [Amycolatopsis sp. PS_44_ISF1]|uniref:hypothetical protein n=1 Tax=Amycolatopsis sp. PS_44_ISF1 TaxID=2974917 RepID=UPI0028E0004B|nr:hypothetical protein [Amycolatopsis sp. PS_44_ISF1]MDT8916253.1 hypothetical protein [Amycolatopsis sp. PS_44_ISF1]